MLQDLIVYLIIVLTISYVALSFINNLRAKKVKSGCEGCTGCDLSKHKTG